MANIAFVSPRVSLLSNNQLVGLVKYPSTFEHFKNKLTQELKFTLRFHYLMRIFYCTEFLHFAPIDNANNNANNNNHSEGQQCLCHRKAFGALPGNRNTFPTLARSVVNTAADFKCPLM